MGLKCKHCRHRGTWECEDYNWGEWEVSRCIDDFDLDFSTLTRTQRLKALTILEMITEMEEQSEES